MEAVSATRMTGRRETDGVVFAYTLSRRRLTLKLFRLLPVGSVRLEHVLYIRQRSGADVHQLFRDMFTHPFRSWYWPHPAMSYSKGQSTSYVLRTRRGCRLYVRMRTGFHYRLRDAVGQAKANAPGRSGRAGLERRGQGAGAPAVQAAVPEHRVEAGNKAGAVPR